jgi:4-amino-4-deoxy-L-arabinose transferase-like glycosyltransferase
VIAALHLVGIDWHLPHVPLSDEKVYWLQVGIARGMEALPFDRVHAHSYPSMLGRVAEVLLPVRAPVAPSTLDALRSWSAQEVLGIRVGIAILSAGIVPATWFAARRLLSEPWAALAAGLASISTLSVWFSSMGRPHAVVVVFATATVAASLRARATGRIVDFVLAGAFAALSVGTLQSGACACAAVAAAWWWNATPRFGRPRNFCRNP